jgi:hypothetical protein
MPMGLRLLGDAIEDLCSGRLVTRTVALQSRLWFPPTATQ